MKEMKHYTPAYEPKDYKPQNGFHITPGGIFGQNGRRYVRISLCADENRMSEALARIQNVFA